MTLAATVDSRFPSLSGTDCAPKPMLSALAGSCVFRLAGSRPVCPCAGAETAQLSGFNGDAVAELVQR